jgi:hypothetical protein
VGELVDGCDEPSYLFIAVENEEGHVEVVRALLEVGGRELAMISIFFPRYSRTSSDTSHRVPADGTMRELIAGVALVPRQVCAPSEMPPARERP